MNKYTIIHINGGIGKNVLATSAISSYKKKFEDRKIIIVTAWEDVWINNPNIYRVYTQNNTPYFYDDFINDKDVKIFKIDPYDTEDYILKKKHLIEIWCDLLGVENLKESPKLYFTPRENSYVYNLIARDKPLMFIQTNGGMNNSIPYSWTRDLPIHIAQKVVDHFKDMYHIYHIRFENQPALNDVEWLNLPLRNVLCAFQFSRKRLLIDSFGQHTSAALGLESVVCWILNKPEILGYELHNNITAKGELLYDSNKYSYLESANLGGLPEQYPFGDLNIFEADKLIEYLSKI